MSEPTGQQVSKDYWDIVLYELGKRPSVICAAILLVVFYAVAIFAPFLANDRPLALTAVDYGAYRKAKGLLVPIGYSIRNLARDGQDAFYDTQAERFLPDSINRFKILAREEDQKISEQDMAQIEADLREGYRALARDGRASSLRAGIDAAKAVLAVSNPDLAPDDIELILRSQVDKALDDIRTWPDAVDQEESAALERVDTMRTYLRPADTGLLDELVVSLGAAASALRAGHTEAAIEAASAYVDVAKRVRAEMGAAGPEGDGEGLQLIEATTYPALTNIGRLEAYFMGLWLLIMSVPLWNRLVNAILGGERLRVRAARRFKVLAVLLLPLACASLGATDVDPLYRSDFKDSLTNGDIVASHVVFPPIPYGLAEQNTSEFFRPPTWDDSAEINAEGYYARGPRAPRDDMAEGTRPVASPVLVQSVEPAANDPTRRVLGTDSLGRDMLARLIWGGRISLSVGFVAAFLIVFLGTIIGSIAGYVGGRTDMLISRVIEVFQCFPVLFFALIVVAFLGPGVLNIMLVIGLLRWTGTARLARGEFIRLRNQEFVIASEALGVSNRRTIFRHVLPNALGPILVSFTFGVAAGILIESTLSYLGFGIKLPVPSWGSLLIESSSAEHWWIQIFPGIVIFMTVMLYNMLGEGLRDALDPRQKAR